jgi:hypothetical protein
VLAGQSHMQLHVAPTRRTRLRGSDTCDKSTHPAGFVAAVSDLALIIWAATDSTNQNSPKCDLIRQFQDTIQDSEVRGKCGDVTGCAHTSS